MNFILCERSGLTLLIIQDSYNGDCWVLSIARFTYGFRHRKPEYKELANMKVRQISNDEGIAILKKYRHRPEIDVFIKRYEMLPF